MGSSQVVENNWQQKKFENGITIYTRKPFNSNFKELKATFNLKTSLSSIVALINDGESYPQWVYKCGNSATLKKINDTLLIHYQTVLVPWPADKRDFVANIELTQDKKTKVVTIKSICNANYSPPVTNYIRITQLNACWTFTPLTNGTVDVNYQLLVNPGGFLPAWLANMVLIDGPYKTMINLKEWVMKKKYQETKLSFISELN